jgi:hypothetical protein
MKLHNQLERNRVSHVATIQQLERNKHFLGMQNYYIDPLKSTREDINLCSTMNDAAQGP